MMRWAGRRRRQLMAEGLAAPDECLLSVVTVNLNNAANLPRTLASLAPLREHPQVQCLFIDGGSTDGSLEIAWRFYRADEVVSEPDAGVYSAMNKGLGRARGKYVLWLNSGDELRPGVFGDIAARLARDGAAIVSFGIEVVPQDGGESYEWIPTVAELPSRGCPHPAAFFRRKTVLRFGGYNERFCIAGDKELILRLFFAGEEVSVGAAVIARFYLGGLSAQGATEIEDAYILAKFSPFSTVKVMYWWLAADRARIAGLWRYVWFRAGRAARALPWYRWAQQRLWRFGALADREGGRSTRDE